MQTLGQLVFKINKRYYSGILLRDKKESWEMLIFFEKFNSKKAEKGNERKQTENSQKDRRVLIQLYK